MKLSDFLTDVGRPVAFYPGLRKITGSTTATLFLCQLIYWTGKEASKDGWVYKTSEQIECETGLSYYEQKGAREKLIEGGLLNEKYARIEHQIYFKVNLDALNDKWGIEEIPHSAIAKSSIPECDISSLGNEEIPNSLISNTENTTKNTSCGSKSKIQMPENAPIDWLIAGGVSSEKIAELNQKEAEVKSATDAFERALNFNPLPWGKNAQWQRFKKFVMGAYQQDPASFKKFHDKREKEGQFSRLPANPKIYQDPDLLIAIWPGLFPRPTEADQSARILASIAAQYHG